MSYLSPGVVDVSSMLAQVEDGFGILVLDGFLVAKLAVGRGAIGWLVGRDDLIVPWQIDQTALTRTTEWRALTAARVALLDDAFCQRAAAATFRA